MFYNYYGKYKIKVHSIIKNIDDDGDDDDDDADDKQSSPNLLELTIMVVRPYTSCETSSLLIEQVLSIFCHFSRTIAKIQTHTHTHIHTHDNGCHLSLPLIALVYSFMLVLTVTLFHLYKSYAATF